MAILSIQSHVVCGYAGNRAATFPLQRLGHEVWALNTVQFSNHTGWPEYSGIIFNSTVLDGILQSIKKNALLPQCSAILSGYLGNAETGHCVLDAVREVKLANPNAIYCCDPVMGDIGNGLFVHKDIPPIFTQNLVPAADILTPNLFELELLCGHPVENDYQAMQAVDTLHRRGPSVILVTSYKPKSRMDDSIRMLVSGPKGKFLIETPQIHITPHPGGAGDFTAAVFLARYLETHDCRLSLEMTTEAVFSVFEKTKALGGRELRILEAQEAIAKPLSRFLSKSLD
jgi:pyridoxine kinase